MQTNQAQASECVTFTADRPKRRTGRKRYRLRDLVYRDGMTWEQAETMAREAKKGKQQ